MKKWIVILVLVLVAGGVGFFYLSIPPKDGLSTDFKEKAVSKLLGRKAQLDEVKEQEGNTSYKGKYISFEYPAKATIYTYKDPSFASSSALLEDFSFDIRKPRLVLNMAVLRNNGRYKSVDDDPGVMFRKNASGQYKEVAILVDGQKGRVFERNDSTPEKTGFFLVHDRFYTISITGTIFTEIKSLSEVIFKSIKFK